jgi:trimeric autotransporter adhesin
MAGEFSSNNGEVSELITWNGTQFNDFGKAFILYPGNKIVELSVVNDILYIGGRFQKVVGSQANNILQWDGDQWGILDEGISGSVNSIISFNGKIYIGGDFQEAGGADADNISIWNEE